MRIGSTETGGGQLTVNEILPDTVGETAVVNTSPELHNHPTWQIVAPGSSVAEDKSISFRLHATGYASSDELTVTLSVFEDDDHEGDDEHEDND